MKRTPLALLSMLLILTALLPGCRERVVFTPADWLLIVEADPNEAGVAYNGNNLYVDGDFSDNLLEFKIETHDAIPDASRDVQFAVYLDTDQDAATGLSASAGWGDNATPNDIGADFMMFVGSDTADGGLINENRIFAWDTTLVTPGWTEIGQVGTPYQPTNQDSVKGSVSEADIGNPAGEIDVVAVLLCDPPGVAYYDHIPDNGHATIDLDSGTVIQQAPHREVVVLNPISGKRVSLITGKEPTVEEVR
jgi:hypothetical protein